MNAFYSLSSLSMVLLLIAATVIFVVSRKKSGDWLLAVFLFSLILNTIWAFVGPILAGMESTSMLVSTFDIISRVLSLLGYGALLGFVLARRRSP